MYDILIGTAGFGSTASIGSHNKDSNYCSIPLPKHDWEGGGGNSRCFLVPAGRLTS